MVYWSVTLKCSLVISLYISDFAELINCPWKMFSFFFPSVLVLLETEGDSKQGHYLCNFPAAGGGVTLLPLSVVSVLRCLCCAAHGIPQRESRGQNSGGKGTVAFELNFGSALTNDTPLLSS